MYRLRIVIFIFLCTAGLNSISMAADMPIKATSAAQSTAYNWTGVYLGGNLGWVREQASGTSNFIDTSPIPGTFPQNQSFSKGAFSGGVQLGYNWQFAPMWVAGIEGDWNWTRPDYSFCRQTSNFSVPCSDNGFGFETLSSKTNWLATMRGRLGITWANWLFYGTGGAAWSNVETNVTLDCRVAGCGNSSTATLLLSSNSTNTKAGWVAGVGAEMLLASNWSIRGEWLHYDLGTISASLVTTGNTGGTQTANWSRTERYDAFRLAFNYLFKS